MGPNLFLAGRAPAFAYFCEQHLTIFKINEVRISCFKAILMVPWGATMVPGGLS